MSDWAAALDRLDVELRRAEALLADPQSAGSLDGWTWCPPAGVGPLPEELLPRARALHERQTSLVHQLAGAMQRSTRQQAYLDTALRPATTHSRYVDLSG